jgi:hypothetical protein
MQIYLHEVVLGDWKSGDGIIFRLEINARMGYFTFL